MGGLNVEIDGHNVVNDVKIGRREKSEGRQKIRDEQTQREGERKHDFERGHEKNDD